MAVCTNSFQKNGKSLKVEEEVFGVLFNLLTKAIEGREKGTAEVLGEHHNELVKYVPSKK